LLFALNDPGGRGLLHRVAMNAGHAGLVGNEAVASECLGHRPVVFEGNELLHVDAPQQAPSGAQVHHIIDISRRRDALGQ
jgi:hypothetical protein